MNSDVWAFVSGFEKRPHVSNQIAVAESKFDFYILKTPLLPRREQCHDREPVFFVDQFVQFIEIEHWKN